MTPTLYVMDYAYSSWSLRGWLLLDAFGMRPALRHAPMHTPEFAALRAEISPSLTVPAARFARDGADPMLVWDSLALAETVHEMWPDAGLWPSDQELRGLARSLTAEMHSGFAALRSACPMNMRRTYDGFVPGEAVLEDVARLSALWAHARATSGSGGPFLFGGFGAVDAFFAPVASRIVTYDLPMGSGDMAYVQALLAHPSVRRWRSMAWASPTQQAHYEFALPQRDDPHAPTLTGQAVTGVAAENDLCPYSGRPVVETSIMQVGRRRVGFCNPFCRDKSAADPLAWDEVRALIKA